ncbi:glucokinase [Singulisphaera sp. PoT]|uniref:glucokinase n=1 Tax=Singulisphaera sp. PoT TaxID=3411797 RepID=UPI003BF5E50B
MFLAGDIGGTKTVLALFESSDKDLHCVREEVYPSRDYKTFDHLLKVFLESSPGQRIESACFGVAGAVVEGRSHATNLNWDLEEGALAKLLGVSRVKLLNDLEAAAYGMLFLKPEEMEVIQEGHPGPDQNRGNIAVIAAGTGLGEAMLYKEGDEHQPIASEGGHADFGPSSDLQLDLWKYLSAKFGGHVSWERVLSGPGIHNLYLFLRDRGEIPESPHVAEEIRTGDPNAAITKHGLDETDPLSEAALDLFCSIYGSEAGNMALRLVAFGGVIIGGGIAPKILPALKRGEFTRAFAAKGRMRSLLEQIEIRVALNPRAPLIGAAHYARRIG